MTPEQINAWLQLGAGGLVFLALVLGQRRVWVFGWQYQAKVDECEQWKTIALRGLDVVETTVTTLTPGDANRAQGVVKATRRA